ESILADALEAILGAIFLDSGMDACRERINVWFAERLAQIAPGEQKDSKTRLQEYLQGLRLALPVYDVIATTGEAHQQTFTVRCTVPGIAPITASGSSRRKAEQDAANAALEQIKNER
ncbi:TPA: ribonuclease III, partial [Candidatus Azambacteria bacterium]|nr:ribonuclease III [Candidatus Azambacteria bacterium]